MTTLADTRRGVENPMVLGEYYSMEDYILDSATAEDMADYVWSRSMETDAVRHWLGEKMSARAALEVWENLTDDAVERISVQYVKAEKLDAFVAWYGGRYGKV
jgi:hypothetical protein